MAVGLVIFGLFLLIVRIALNKYREKVDKLVSTFIKNQFWKGILKKLTISYIQILSVMAVSSKKLLDGYTKNK